MSAITQNQHHNHLLADIRHYQTRIKVIIHSHLASEPLDVSRDVHSGSVSKNIQGTGRANISLVSTTNLLNHIYPNDVINIYFSINDGQGWTRTFFGYVDRIEEEYSVGSDGKADSVYHVIASDWQKALEKTQVYFNPHLSGRRDINGSDFATGNIGGISLISRGLVAEGAPPDVVINLLLLQLGFGAQWVLPSCYRPRIPQRFQELRRQYANSVLLRSMRNRLTNEAYSRLERLVNSGDLERLRQEAVDRSAASVSSDQGFPPDVRSAITERGLDPDELPATIGNLGSTADIEAITRITFNNEVREALGDNPTRQGGPLRLEEPEINAYFNTMETDIRVGNACLLDIVNLFDFVERKAMDGFTFDHGIWEKQGPLLNIIRSASNEVVNELIFDMRPMTVEPGLQEGDEWDRTPDEIAGNTPDEYVSEAGVRYVPAVIMREYPFSTVHEVDATGISLRQRDGSSGIVTGGNFGIMYFGAIFSNEPNVPGRHTVEIPVINVEEQAQGLPNQENVAKKHIDVAVVHETEIIQTRFGRSDQDLFNLFEIWTDNALGSAHRFFLKDFIPIITPISIMRHGLRVRSQSSRFARYDLDTIPNTQQTPTEASQPEDEPVDTGSMSRELVAPVASHPSLSYVNAGGADYGYRFRAGRGATGVRAWVYHNGIDIFGDEGEVDIVAIADGYVVGSIASGTAGMSYYGNTVVIYHPQFSGPNGEPVYSLYAHLASRDPSVGNTNNVRNIADSAADGGTERTGDGQHYGGRNFEPIRVSAGQVIGKMGQTSGSRPRNENDPPGSPRTIQDPSITFNTSRAHLHFEIDFRWPPKYKTDTPNIPGSEASTEAEAIAAAQTRGARGSNSRNMDPVEFFSNNGVDLVAEIRRLGADSEEIEPPDDEGGGADESDDDLAQTTSRVEDDATTARSAGARRRLTGITNEQQSRKQIGRWALLQDHWYQHNVEYLSGQITMRGAPEIRVGYRLDIPERNLSFYVESVQHSWSYPNEMKTTLNVTRGQPNNPYPSYALPPTPGFNTREIARRATSRLARYAIVPDPIAVRKAISLGGDGSVYHLTGDDTPDRNLLDAKDVWGTEEYNFGELPEGLIPAETTTRRVVQGLPDNEPTTLDTLGNLESDFFSDLVDADEDDPLLSRREEVEEETSSVAGVDGAASPEQNLGD